MKSVFAFFFILTSLCYPAEVFADNVLKSRVIMPENNAYMKWDVPAIGIKMLERKDKPGKHYFLHLKGHILAKKVNSFSYQMNSGDAQKVQFKDNVFEVDALIDAIPAVVRLWMEVAEGKGIRIENYEVSIEPEGRVAPNTKLINY